MGYMAGAKTVESIRPSQDEAVGLSHSDEGDTLVLTEAPAPEPEPVYETEDEPERRRGGWLAPTLTILAVLGWFGGALWLLRDTLTGSIAPVALVELIAALCVPPALICVVYLLALRTSTAEAQRFGASARAMRAEAASLERVVATLSRKIEANRAELHHQTNAMLAMGEAAAERLSALANDMGRQAQTVDVSTRTLSDAVTGAEQSVANVLASLPKAHDEMQGMTARVDAAGQLAAERASALDTQLTALAARGREADDIATGAAQRLAAHVAKMEATSETASARLEQVTGAMSTEVDAVLDRAGQAVDEARKSIAAQGEAMLAMLGANQAALDSAGKDSADALAARIATIEEAVGRISARLGEEKDRGDELFRALSEGVTRTDREIQVLHAAGMDRTQALAAQVSALGESFAATGTMMRTGEETAQAVIRTSEALLVALDASAREIDETLPEALDRLDARIMESRKVVAGSKPELLALVTAAESTHDAIEAIADVVSKQRDTLAKTQASLIETLESGSEKADQLERIVDDTISTTRRFAEEAAPQLVEALLRVRETSAQAADHARATLAGIVPAAAAALEEAGGEALRRAVDATVRRQIADLAETSDAAVSAASRASERLTQQMLSLAETTAQVEAQIEKGRAEREEADSDSFARRVSLLIEGLNSTSIDITKTFSTEVSDSAWNAYLKGDRGVFTRRAVRLLDAGETREVVRFYDEDEAFRDNVNRYIHDFEAMLRQILALRDGSPLGVTLLSSDMGKLYVALAQAIERLRS
jgi:hypothetical protein